MLVIIIDCGSSFFVQKYVSPGLHIQHKDMMTCKDNEKEVMCINLGTEIKKKLCICTGFFKSIGTDYLFISFFYFFGYIFLWGKESLNEQTRLVNGHRAF